MSSKLTVISAFVLGALLLLNTVQAYAHNGVDDGDDESGPQVSGTPLQELYPGIYSFEDSVSNNVNRMRGMATPAVP